MDVPIPDRSASSVQFTMQSEHYLMLAQVATPLSTAAEATVQHKLQGGEGPDENLEGENS